MVEETIRGELRLNQPAGHLEDKESLIDAVIRETAEETAYPFTPEALVGMYRWRHPLKEATFLRFGFIGSVGEQLDQPLDSDIDRALWLTLDEIEARREQCRSPLVIQSIHDYLNGKRYSLDFLNES